MSQLLGLVTQMHGDKAVTDINYSTDVWMTECSRLADADPQNILEPLIDGRYLCLKSSRNHKLLSTEAMFGFCLHC